MTKWFIFFSYIKLKIIYKLFGLHMDSRQLGAVTVYSLFLVLLKYLQHNNRLHFHKGHNFQTQS